MSKKVVSASFVNLFCASTFNTMKSTFLIQACAILCFLFTAPAASVGDPKPTAIDYGIAIPADLLSRLEIENHDNTVRYNFKKSDGTSCFLFSLNRIAEQQWLGVKDQLPNAKLCGHKNGFIYYAEVTNKTRMTGEDKDAYAAVYSRLTEIVRSVEIRN